MFYRKEDDLQCNVNVLNFHILRNIRGRLIAHTVCQKALAQ